MLCAAMDNLSIEEKEKCISFGSAMNAIEGTEVTDETKTRFKLGYVERKHFSRFLKIRYRDTGSR